MKDFIFILPQYGAIYYALRARAIYILPFLLGHAELATNLFPSSFFSNSLAEMLTLLDKDGNDITNQRSFCDQPNCLGEPWWAWELEFAKGRL